MPERGRDHQKIFCDPGLIEVQYAGKVFGRYGNTDFTGGYIDTLSERQMDIVSIIRCACFQIPQ